MKLTAGTHHLVRAALVGAKVTNVVHVLKPGEPDRLVLELDNKTKVAIVGEPLDLRFDD